jgi:hypothetical protein
MYNISLLPGLYWAGSSWLSALSCPGPGYDGEQCCGSEIIIISDPDPALSLISDPDPDSDCYEKYFWTVDLQII